MIKKLIKLIFYLFLLCALIITIGVYFPVPDLPNVGSYGNTYIRNVNVVDIETGNVHPAQNILIRDGRIVEISAENIRPPDELIIIVEGTEKYLIPGLWDMHSKSLKLSPYFHHPLFIANGITHLRDLSGCLDKKDAYWACTKDRNDWTRSAERGEAISPAYHQNSTYPINGGKEIPDSFKSFLKADSSDKAKGLANFSEMQSADFITLGPNLSRDAYYGLAVEAARKGLTLSGAKPTEASLQEALATYQRSIDEPSLFAVECYSNARDLRSQDASVLIQKANIRQRIVSNQDQIRCGALMTAMASSDTWWTPTLSQLIPAINANSNKNNELNKYIPLVMRYGHWKVLDKNLSTSDNSGSQDSHRDFFELSQKQTGLANLTGVRMLAGTNSLNRYTYSGFSLHNELAYMGDSGLSPLQALRTATYNPAIFSGVVKDFGSIQVGKQGDLVLLDANPLDDIRNIKRVHAVVSQQTYYNKEDLDTLLKFTEKQSISWHMNIKLAYDSIKSPLMRHQLKQDYQSTKNKK